MITAAAPEVRPSEDTLHEHLQMLSDVIKTQNEIAGIELDPDLIMRVMAERTRSLTVADGAMIELLDAGEMVCRAGTGIAASCVGQRKPPSASISAATLAANEPICCADTRVDPRVSREIARQTGALSLIAVPLIHLGKPIGVLKVSSRRVSAFTAAHVKALELMVGMLSAALANAAEFRIKKQLLAERRESEERFRSAFDHAAIGMAIVSLDGRWLQVNNSLCRIVGYTCEELLARTFQSITHPDDLTDDLALIGRLILGEVADFQMIKRYFHKQGHIVWILLAVSLVRDEAGKPLYFISQIQDITEQKLAGWLEEDRGAVLEMAARDEPLQRTLTRVAGAVHRQIGGCTALMSLHDGKFLLHNFNLSAECAGALADRPLALIERLAMHAASSPDTCSVTNIHSDEIWASCADAPQRDEVVSCWAVPIRSSDDSLFGLALVFRSDTNRPSPRELRILSTAGQLALVCIESYLAKHHMAHLVGHDPLTGLPNRRTLDERLQHALSLSNRSGNCVAVMVLDVDHFKSINDTLGHDAGDELLQKFADRVGAMLRETDTLARIGGDEFVIVLPELEQSDRAAVVGTKVIEGLIEPFALAGGQTVRATSSIGIALAPRDGKDAATLKKNADEALYRAKQQGRNCFSF